MRLPCFRGARRAGRQGCVTRRAEDLQQIYLDNEHFTVRGFAPFATLVGDTWYLVPAEVDPPEHGLLRALVNPLFTPRRMAVLEEKIRVYAREYVERFRNRGGCEFLAEFAFEFPIKVFMELMGLPQDRTALFMAWEHKLLHEPNLEEIKKATRAVVAYLREEMADRRVNPRDMLGPTAGSGSALANRRRILRRGLPYGRVDPANPTDDGEHGIVFLAICSSLFRQFEFVQQQWVQYGLDFNVDSDTCPIVGNHGQSGQAPANYVIPVDPNGSATPFVCAGVPQFVEPRGGEYFFVPSMTALRMIGMGIVDPT